MEMQENFVMHVPWHWWSNDHIYGDSRKLSHIFRDTDKPMNQWPYMVDFGFYRELLSHARTCKAWCLFLLLLLVKLRSNETLASVRLAPNYPFSTSMADNWKWLPALHLVTCNSIIFCVGGSKQKEYFIYQSCKCAVWKIKHSRLNTFTK